MKDLGTIRLETERLILRKFTIEDSQEMYDNWGTDPLVNRYLGWSLHKDVNETKEIIKEWINGYGDGEYNWVIELKDTHELIGSITVIDIHKKDLNAEVGYCSSSKFWGKGYSTEALSKVLDFLFNEVGLHLVEAYHIVENVGSGKVLEKSGMKKEGILRERQYIKALNKYCDWAVYSITKDEFKEKNK